ncbi:hypothetical protein BGX23_011762 [Mortierella sp. AD031]|nr:hypothetical protein BGX23_011762 [Mortierella sp. AD031]
MDLLSKLPLECLQHILRILDEEHNYQSMAALLSTNKYIASVTLPYLYRNPFQFHFHAMRSEKKNTIDGVHTVPLLVRMLLNCLPAASFPKALSFALALDPSNTTRTTTKSPLDYLAHVHHLQVSYICLEVDCNWKIGRAHDPDRRLVDFAKSDEFAKIYRSDPLSPGYGDDTLLDDTHRYYHRILQHEALWALAYPILEQLQSLTIHRMWSIQHFLKLIHRLGNLECVHFDMTDSSNPCLGRVDEFAGECSDAGVQDIVRFVREHARLFKGRLKSVTTMQEDAFHMSRGITKDVQMEIYHILPPIANLVYLGRHYWPRLLAHPHTTDLTRVEMLSGENLPDLWYDTVCDNQPVLQRCRALQKLFIGSFRRGIFEWAVQEKRDMEALGGVTTVGNIHGEEGSAAPETSQPSYQPYGLVPLEHIQITNFNAPLTDEIKDPIIPPTNDFDDIAFAFSHSLKNLSITTTFSRPTDPRRTLHIGQGWVDLPFLTCLEIQADVHRLVIDPQLLAHCPNVTTVRMTDYTMEYQCQDIVPCSPAALASLAYLRLSGWPALTFDPATLSSTPNLVSLDISVHRADDSYDDGGYEPSFIPPVRELYRSYGIHDDPALEDEEDERAAIPSIIRPRWSWDWHLPSLKALNLASEFAFLFEFKMLHRYPTLESLTLDIRSNAEGGGGGEHIRVLSEADLFVSAATTADSILSSSPSPSTERLCLPSLRHLSLCGEWVIDKTLLSQLFTDTFPNLESMDMLEWSFSTLKGLLKSIRSKQIPFKNHVRIRITDPSTEEEAKLGLKVLINLGCGFEEVEPDEEGKEEKEGGWEERRYIELVGVTFTLLDTHYLKLLFLEDMPE